jgi:hypothetical protein
MKTLTLAAVITLAASPAFAVPFCHTPQTSGPVIIFQIEIGDLGESDRAMFYELRLRKMGIHASNTRFWNECIQTFVRENGRETMRFYDPWTLEDIPVD